MRRTYVYSPPDDGMAVPSSAYEAAPSNAITPARIHAISADPGDAVCSKTNPGEANMPFGVHVGSACGGRMKYNVYHSKRVCAKSDTIVSIGRVELYRESSCKEGKCRQARSYNAEPPHSVAEEHVCGGGGYILFEPDPIIVPAMIETPPSNPSDFPILGR